MVIDELTRLQALPMNWETNDDLEIRKGLSSLSRELDRMLLLKTGGVSAMPAALAVRVTNYIVALQKRGLFIVPVGELESWLQIHCVTASRKQKWAWANEAASKIRLRRETDGDIWEFVRGIGAHLFLPESCSALLDAPVADVSLAT
jgi:hypothetical protein